MQLALSSQLSVSCRGNLQVWYRTLFHKHGTSSCEKLKQFNLNIERRMGLSKYRFAKGLSRRARKIGGKTKKGFSFDLEVLDLWPCAKVYY